MIHVVELLVSQTYTSPVKTPDKVITLINSIFSQGLSKLLFKNFSLFKVYPKKENDKLK